MQLEQLFNDTEKEKLNKFVNDEELVTIVKKVVLSAVYGFEGTFSPDRPQNNFALTFADGVTFGKLSQKEIGQRLQASLSAVQLVNDGFARLQKFNNKNKDKQEGERSNPAR